MYGMYTVPSLCFPQHTSISGEFGIVYKGHVVRNRGSGQYLNEYLAIKTLKGTYDVNILIVYMYKYAMYNIMALHAFH